MFQKLKLSTKIALLVAASLLGLLFAVIYSATSMRNDMFEARRLQIRSVTEAVYNTLTDIDAQAKAGNPVDARIINSSTGRYVERLIHYLEKIDTTNTYSIFVW